jgi:cytochrome b
MSGVKVWDPLVRVLHWGLVASVSTAMIVALAHGSQKLHELAGYTALTLVAIRVVWGFWSKGHARFTRFLRAPRHVVAYVASLRAGGEQAYAGHNPLGGWMTVALLTVVAFTTATGWLFNTDRFWGYGWLSALHEALAWALLALVVIHLCGVVVMSLRYRENLARAMVTGYKKLQR